ncbi:hypothetical protein ACRRTK_023592 [Alexandromys fortis]
MLQDLSPARHTICCKPRASSASVTFPHSGSLLSPDLLEGSPNLPLSPCVAPCSTCPIGNFFGVCQQPPLQSPKGVVAISVSWARCAHDLVDRRLGGSGDLPRGPCASGRAGLDSTHPAGDSTLVTTWDTVSACLGQPGFRTGAFNVRFSLSAIAKVPLPQMTRK